MAGGISNKLFKQNKYFEMKKLIILSIGLLSLQLSAQNIELTILPQSIRVQDNLLYFIYRIQNNSDSIFVLYNVRGFDYATHEEQYYEYAPRLSAFIYDNNDELKQRKWIRMLRYQKPGSPVVRTYEDSITDISFGKYIILNSGKAVEYDGRLRIENFELEKGIYKFQLRYFSSNHYRQIYIKAKKKDALLKNSLLFEGVIRSNVCSFKL
jgi:hypothetical protein